jgi:hypothetical protein
MSAKAVVITARTFKCAKGHVWKGTSAPNYLFSGGDTVAASGAICPTCIADFLRLNFGMVEVAEEKATDEG